MKWKNLKDFKCPSCGGELQHIVPRGIECKTCPFLISHAKFEKIIADMYKRKETDYLDDPDERLSELNNYGRKPMSEDFSDSPFLRLKENPWQPEN